MRPFLSLPLNILQYETVNPACKQPNQSVHTLYCVQYVTVNPACKQPNQSVHMIHCTVYKPYFYIYFIV